MASMNKTVMCEDSIDSIYELFYKNGWTDGLPIIPPTRERVDEMMSTVGLPPGKCIAQLRPKMGDATIEKLAINAVMSGCLPSYFPVIVAAVEAIAEPRFNLFGMNTSTTTAAPMLIINGPVRQKIDLNCSHGVFGPGWRANATLGRAISLIMLNIAGRIPGEVSKSVLAWPGRYGICIGEREEESPWAPLHVELGFQQNESTVTVLSPPSFHMLEDLESTMAGPLLTNLAGAMHQSLTINTYPWWGKGEVLLVMCPAHARILSQAGYSKQDVKEYFYHHINIPHSFFSEDVLNKMIEMDREASDPKSGRRQMIEEGLIKEGTVQVTDRGVKLLARPEQLLIIVAGGDGRLHSAYLPTFGDSQAVTKPIRLK